MSDRMLKVNELILQQLGSIIARVVEMPDVFVTIMRVSTSADLKYATVYIGVIPDDKADYAVKKLNMLSKRLQMELSRKIVLRSVPKLDFRMNKGAEKNENIDDILDEIKKNMSEE